MTPRILAFSGSARTGSLNRHLLEAAVGGARAAGAEVTTLLLSEFPLPLYDGDLEASDGVPLHAQALQSLVAQHDALLIASPEYNGGYTALLKNTLDWISRPRTDGSPGTAVFADKLAAVISASPGVLGGVRSQIGLKIVLDKLGVTVIPQSFALGNAHHAFDAEGAFLDKKVDALVAGVGRSLARATAALRSAA